MSPIDGQAGESRREIAPGYLEVIGLALLITLGALFFYDRFLVPRVVAFDMQGYLQRQKTLVTTGAITEDEWRKGLDHLEQVFRDQPKRHTIIVNDVVLRHGNDTELDIR
jgi:hypothetical protein